MHLYGGTVAEAARQVGDEAFIAASEQRFGRIFGVAPHPEEVQSWRRSWPALTQILCEPPRDIGTPNVGVVVRFGVRTVMSDAPEPQEADGAWGAGRAAPRSGTRDVESATDALEDRRGGLPSQYATAVDVGAGCGLRQGEIFGLAVDEVDFVGGAVHVVRQVKLVGPQMVFAPPKGGKLRDVPLPDVVSDALAAHITRRPPSTSLCRGRLRTARRSQQNCCSTRVSARR